MAFPLRCGTAIEPLRSRRLAPSQAALGPSAIGVAILAHRGLRVLIWVNRPALHRHHGFHSRTIRRASTVYAGVILALPAAAAK